MQVFPLKASQRESRNKGSLFGGCVGIAADTIQSPRHDNTQYSHEDQHTTWLGIEPSRVTSYLPCGRTYGALWHIILAGLLGDTNDARPFLCFAEASRSRCCDHVVSNGHRSCARATPGNWRCDGVASAWPSSFCALLCCSIRQLTLRRCCTASCFCLSFFREDDAVNNHGTLAALAGAHDHLFVFLSQSVRPTKRFT